MAPFIKDLVLKDVKSLLYFLVLFDESLNKVLQQSQMDIQLRYWNDGDGLIKTRYCDFQFMMDDDDEFCFCDMVDQRKTISLISRGGPLSENFWHAMGRIWTCIKPEFRLWWMKLCSSDKHYTMAPHNQA